MSSAPQSERSSIASDQPKPARIYLHILDYETKEFSGLTTYHGLVRIYNSRTWPSRIFWCVTVLSCLSLFMIHSGILLWGFYQKPTVTQINIMVPRDGLLFPDVTICNINPVSLTRIRERNISDGLLQYLLHFYDNRVTAEWPGIVVQHEEFLEFVAREENRTGTAFDIADFFLSVGHTCSETMKECFWAGELIQDCCSLVEDVLTEYGKCFRFSNKKVKRKQWFSGWSFGFEFTIDNRLNERPDVLPDKFSDYGMKILVHQSADFPFINSNPLSVPPGEKLYAGVDTFNKTHLPYNDWGSCQPKWDPKKHGEIRVPFNYSSSHCAANCAMNSMMEACGCVQLVDRIAGNDTVCTPLEAVQCRQRNESSIDLFCDCPIECFYLEYFIIPSYTLLDFEDSNSQQLSQVAVYFNEISYEHHEQQKQLQMADLLSNIAGSMGLFLGMSTVTLLEIFIYLFKSVWGTVNTERERQFVQAMIDEEAERRQSLVIVEEGGEESEDGADVTPGDRRMSRRFSRISLFQQQPFGGGRRLSQFRRPSMLRRSSEQYGTNGDIRISFDHRPRQSISFFDRRPSTFDRRRPSQLDDGGTNRRLSTVPSGDSMARSPVADMHDGRRKSMFDGNRRMSLFNQRKPSYMDIEEGEPTPPPMNSLLPPSGRRMSAFDGRRLPLNDGTLRRQSLRPPGEEIIDSQPGMAALSRRPSTQSSRILVARRPSMQSNNDIHLSIVNPTGRRRSSVRTYGMNLF
uniref:Amiloride-sensitive cation channel 5 n=1 Tax=Steinernema glaseri TaxID=37863 RepID=A0A1I7ZPP2_9BILA